MHGSQKLLPCTRLQTLKFRGYSWFASVRNDLNQTRVFDRQHRHLLRNPDSHDKQFPLSEDEGEERIIARYLLWDIYKRASYDRAG